MRYSALLTTLCLVLGCNPVPADKTDALHPDGRWLVVNYWAEWCKPCRDEIPQLNRVATELESGVAVLGVNYDYLAGAELQQAVDAMAIDFESTGDDPAASLGVPRPKVLPTTYIFNPQGKLAHTLLGPQNYEQLTALLPPASSPN